MLVTPLCRDQVQPLLQYLGQSDLRMAILSPVCVVQQAEGGQEQAKRWQRDSFLAEDTQGHSQGTTIGHEWCELLDEERSG